MAEPARDDLLPVLAEVRTIERDEPDDLAWPAAASPAVQAAAVAATGFVAGAATVALVRRRAARKAAPARRRKRRGADLIDVAASRSFLVDIHLLNPRD
ncbi:MAG: hypothetical protein QOI91_2751 [Solirubrobacteraceae bacterium]|jgi:hypothetical protein|nr:hypothetical protein [Solirubrobacteraceae bacterium]MDX6672388.1 hypothetical protein [Solirubrobacteraceae bacterium]